MEPAGGAAIVSPVPTSPRPNRRSDEVGVPRLDVWLHPAQNIISNNAGKVDRLSKRFITYLPLAWAELGGLFKRVLETL